MKIWIVFVKVVSNNTLVCRYIDSQWAQKKAAVDRKDELERSISVFGRLSQESGSTVYLVEGSVTDVVITEKEQPTT